ncbi:MAG: formyltransferase [Candidatus Binatia bacterium]
MRNVVLAYHDIGAACLEELIATGDEVALVVTHEDSPGENVWFRSVAELAERHAIPVIAPRDVNAPEVEKAIAAARPDLLLSAMFRQLLKPPLLELAPRGALNLHPSLLPKYRGRAPINWAILNGERETGVTLHYMVEKPDRGEIVAQRRFPIDADDTALSVHRKATAAARELVREAYPLLVSGRAPRIPQDHSRASYFGGRRPADGEIDWRWPAKRIYDLVRAVTHPYPGAFTSHRGRQLFVWWAHPVERQPGLAPGELEVVSSAAVLAGAGDGALRLERIQPAEAEEVTAIEWAERSGARSGDVLGRMP